MIGFKKYLFAMLIFMFPAIVWSASPYDASTYITGISWNASSHEEGARGTDNWPVTWADDDLQYTLGGDGNGFQGSTKMSLILATLAGATPDVAVGTDVYECPAAGTNACEGKSYGIVSIGGALYAWWGPTSGNNYLTETRMMKSTNDGVSWTWSDWDLTTVSSNITSGTILNYGQEYAWNTDGYVYHYFVRNETGTLAVQSTPGDIWLARISTTDIVTLNDIDDNLEWFTGCSSSPCTASNAQWGNPGDESVRQPVFENDTDGVGWCLSVSYNGPLNRYFLMTENTTTFHGNLGMFDAPNPWGPWTTVVYYNGANDFKAEAELLDTTGLNNGTGGNAFYWNFSNKWLSGDGLTFVIIWTGTSASPTSDWDDSYNSVGGTFTYVGPSTVRTIQGLTIQGGSIH